ncbi:hypothetical protein CC86DRAFT_329762 [Ophiobolus disseminans]|uniref:Zn(2)-C6 fungal-type domain-containing protein n=1 Tax=Ophiobolus disseminans TaxID=1469910 RepID=A0A6A6ZQ02_9PLEO|nr:hypothetical protein CC86DRAFT_329762 [Ophiobolus disseminans]
MEDITEQPSATRAAIARTSQACQRCRSLKTRCLPSPQAGVCQRCVVGSKECIWAETPRRARKLRAPSRISQVEEKIDGLVASLVNPPARPTVDIQEPTPATGNSAPKRGNGLAETWRQQGHVAPGSWLPFPASFEPGSSRPEQGIEQAEGAAEADRQYVEKIRTVHRHNFGDSEDSSHAPESLFQPSKRAEPPIENELLQQLLADHEADALLSEFRLMSTSFPFVIIPPGMTAHDLHVERPMLFLAVIMTASWREHQRQMMLDTVFRRELAERTIISPQRTLGLVQSLLVYLSWYHFVFSHRTQQIFFLHHLVIGLALDIGLHQDYQPLNFPHRPKPPPPSPKDQRERQRAFLGCYYLSSMIGAGLQKPNLLKHTSHMTDWAQDLKQEREYDSDETISHLITLRQLDDQVQDTLFTGSANDLPLSDTRTLMHVRFLESQLDAWKKNSQNAGAQRLLELSSSFTEMLTHSVALRPTPPTNSPPTISSTHLTTLLSTLEAGKRFLDALLSFPIHEYHLISFSEWMRLPTVIMTVAKLCMPTAAHAAVGWDTTAAQDRVRLDLCLEALCYRMQQLSTYNKASQPHPDFWCAMRFINDLTRAWYLRKIGLDASSASGASGASSAGCTIGSEKDTTTGALPTPSTEHDFSTYGMDIGNADLSMDVDDGGDPFAFMKDLDFDMEQFLDMGIWSDDTYKSMGFGGGMGG